MFPWSETGILGNFWGRIKGAKYRFAFHSRGSPIWLGTRREPGRAGAKPGGAGLGGGAKFVEFLAPHDVSVFHSSTTPYKLPPWSDRPQAGEGPSPWAARGGLSPAGWGPGRATPDVGPLPTSPPLDSAAAPQCALPKGPACL